MKKELPTDAYARIGSLNTAVTTLLEELFLFDSFATEEEERLQLMRDSWLANLAYQHA